MKAGQQDAEVPAIITSGASGDPVAVPSLRVLLADHDPIVMEVFGVCLRREGYEIDLAEDGQRAWELLTAAEPCRIVILDFSLPVLSCLEIVRRLRERTQDRYTYIIILTRQVSRSDLRLALTSAADDVLILPFLFEVLIQRLQVAQRIIALEDKLARRNAVLEEMNERHRQELQAAVDVQRTLLPPASLGIPGLETAWMYRPSTELGGDLLQVARIGSRWINFYVLDVSGHGVASALLAVQASRHLTPSAGEASLVQYTLPDGSIAPVAPEIVLQRLNVMFPMDRRTRLYFTILYGVLDLQEATVALAAAGHPGPILVRQNGMAEHIKTRSVPIGWLPGSAAKVQSFGLILKPGDRLFLFSDGVIEAANAQEQPFEVDRLVELVRDQQLASPDRVLESVWQALSAWTGRAETCEDDVSILVIGHALQRPTLGRGSGG